MSNRLLFAINHKQAEEGISARIKPDYLVVGAVQYREAVISSLISTEADVLLIRESLPGSLNFFSLIKDIRTQLPHVRIVCMVNERDDPKDKMLPGLVSLGIYDILNMNTISINDICSYVLNPRTFRDVVHYYEGVPAIAQPEKEKEGAEPPEPVKKKPWAIGHKKPVQASVEPEPAVKVPEITANTSVVAPDYDAMRKAIQEEADRKAQAKIEEIATAMAKTGNKEISKTLEAQKKAYELLLQEKEAVDQQKFQITKELDASVRKVHALEQELKTAKETGTAAVQEMATQLESLKTTEDPEWFSEQMSKWSQQEHDYQVKIEQLNKEVAENKGHVIDVSTMTDADYIIPDTVANYVPAGDGTPQVCLFSGTKHGVGNTTVALNIATELANQGHKTLLIEMNPHYPLLNEFFEFINVQRGIDTAISSMRVGNITAVEAAVIKPHGLTSTSKQLDKVYKQLPPALHFMLFSNLYLKQEKNKVNAPFTVKDMTSLFHQLTTRMGYAYIIVDVQPDDAMSDILIRAEGLVNQMTFTCTQDPHSVSIAGILISELTKNGGKQLLDKTKIIVNQFSPDNHLSVEKIAKWLNLPEQRFSTLSDDRTGYLNAASTMLPYVLGHAKYKEEYQPIVKNF